MLVIGYTLGIRSERRLCEEVHLNLAYRWFCRLGLDSKVPDHSTFSKYRHGKFRDSDLLRVVFEAVVARCISEGLVGGHGFAVDASLIEADVDRQNSSAQTEWDANAIDPKDAPRAVREYLDVLDDKAFGAATAVKPKFTSHSDPASQWTAARKGPAIFSYSNNYLIDTDNAVIVDVEATRSIRTAEVGASQTMVDLGQGEVAAIKVVAEHRAGLCAAFHVPWTRTEGGEVQMQAADAEEVEAEVADWR